MPEPKKLVPVILILLSAILLAYSNSFQSSFQFDGVDIIDALAESYPGKLSFGYLKDALNVNNKPFIYRPVAALSLAVNYHVSQREVESYHIFNIALHFLSAAVLFLFLYETFSRHCGIGAIRKHAFYAAFIGSLLWSLHPIQTQAVTYIVQRMALLAAFFSLLSIYSYALYRRTARKALMLLMVLSMLAAFGSKENTLILPVLILVYEWLFYQRGSLSFFWRRQTLLWVGLILLIVAAAGATLRGPAILNKSLQRFHQETMPGRDYSLKERLLTEQRVVLYYISLMIYPNLDRFNVDHDFEISRGWLNPPTTLFSGIIIAGLLLLAWGKRKTFPFLAWAIYWYFLALLIESSIFNLEIIFEHRAYLPSAMGFALIGVGLVVMQDLPVMTRVPYLPKVFVILFVVILAYSTYQRNFIWKNPLTLWSDCVRKSPKKPRGYINLGTAFSEQGQPKEAFALYRKALALAPGNYYAHCNLGDEFMELKAYEKALYHFSEATKAKPQSSLAFSKLGLAYLKRHDLERSKANFERALELKEENHEARNNLALIHYHEGRYNEAISLLEVVLAQKEDLDQVQFNLGLLYKKLEDHERAAFWIERALDASESLLRKVHLIEVYHRASEEGKASMMFRSLLRDLKAKGLTKKDFWQAHLKPLQTERASSTYPNPVSEMDYSQWRRLLIHDDHPMPQSKNDQ